MKSVFKLLVCLMLISIPASAQVIGGPVVGGGGGGNPNVSNATGTLPVANGGTNATTASNARLNLGVSALNASAQLPNFTAGLQNVINNVGGSFPKICAAGDSTTGGTDGAINNVNYSYPTWVALMLQSAYGVKSSYSSFWGMGTGNGNGPAYGLTTGSSWTADSAVLSAGGYAFTATTNTNSLAYNPQDVFANALSVDTFKVYYVVQSGNGVLYEDVDGANSSTFSTSGTSAVGVTTVTTTLGTHTLNLKWSSGGKVDVIGVEAYNSTVPAVLVDNYGVGSQTAFGGANTATNPWNPGNSALYTALGCTVSVTNYGINDEDTSVSQGNFIAAMTTILNAQKVAGDVVVATHNPSNPSGGGAAIATQTAFMAALKTLAVSLSMPVVDTYNRWQTYTYSSPYGVYGDTFVHPNAQGYHEIATAVLQALVGIPVPGSDQASFLGSRLFIHPTNGNVGINNVNPGAALTVGNSVSGGGSLEIDSSSSSQQAIVVTNNQAGYYAGTDYTSAGGAHFLAGVGGSGAGLGVASKYFIFDWGSSVVPLVINSSDNVGIGTTGPATKLDVNGDITMETGTAGAVLCLTAAHALGHCTAAASCTSTCTCTCTAN